MLDQQPHGAEHEEHEPQPSHALYTRPMPGGGYVRVELDANGGVSAAHERRRGRV